VSYHAFGQEEPLPPDSGAPLCNDPNQWKEGSTCSEEICKTGFFWNGVGCVAIAKTGIPTVDVSPTLEQMQEECVDGGGEWDFETGCIHGGTGTRVPDEEDTSGGGGGGFTPTEPSSFDPGIVAASSSGAKLPGWVWAVGAALAVVAVAVAVAPNGGERR
jgi:hypothetical protein